MKAIFTLCLSYFFVVGAYAQQTGVLKGTVHDSATNVSLESATVSIFDKDSVLLNYQLTDKNGNFLIDKISLKRKILLSITYVGYNSFNKYIMLDSVATNGINVMLSPNYADSNKVTVTSYVPIRMNGDTLEINPAAFKLKPNAVVEDLLNQVPGVTIWSDGSITVNGKKVPQVLVDGKPFMGQGDATIATQNLPKNAIDKIQVYSQVDRSKQPQGGDANAPKDSILTMNIKLKEDAKKGYFGKVGAGYGTDGRYEGNLIFQVYNKRNSLGIGGGINSVNKDIGSLQDLFKDNTFRSYNPNLYRVGNFSNNGINKNYSIGAIAMHSFIDNTNDRQNDRLMVNYNFSGNDNYTNRYSFQNRTTKDNPQQIESHSDNNGTNQTHTIGANYVKNSGWNDNLNITANSTISNRTADNVSKTFVRDTANNLLSTNDVRTNTTSKSDKESLAVSYSKYDQDNPVKQVWSDLNLNTNNSTSDRRQTSIFKSFTDSTQNTTYNRLYNTTSNNLSLNANINYQGFKRLLFGRFNFFRIDVRLNQGISYSKDRSFNNVFDFDTTLNKFFMNKRLSNNNVLENFAYTPSIQFGKNFFKYFPGFQRFIFLNFSLSDEIRNEKNTSSLNYRNISRSFNFLTPQANFQYQKNKQNGYEIAASANYNRSFSYPTIDQLRPIVDSINIYNLQIGNPNLKNTANNRTNFRLDYTRRKPKSKIDFGTNINGGYNWYSNPIADSTINDSSGRRIVYFVNVGNKKDFNLTYALNIAKKFKENSLQLRYSINYTHAVSPNYIDGIYTTAQNNTIGHSINLQYAIKTLLILSIDENLSTYKSKQSNAGLSSFSNNSSATKLGAQLNYSQTFSFGNTISFTRSSNLNNTIVLWNSFATFRFLKSEQAEIKFSALDILKQFKNISNSVNIDGTTTTTTNGLRQYFMVTLSYFPRKIGKREIKQK